MRIPHLAVAGATLAATLATAVPTHAGAAADPATRALQFLAGQQAPTGAIAGLGSTEDALIGTADAGYDPATLVPASGHSAFAYLAAQVTAGKADADGGSTAKLILALAAGHLDPTAFAGKDLVAELLGATQFDSGTGLFSPAAPNTFSQSLAILALKAAGHAVPAKAVAALLAMQRSDDHGWGYDTTSFTTRSDSNSTALALEALAAVGPVPPILLAGALGYLHGLQAGNGGFGFDATPGTVSDPDSDAYVVQGLSAVGQDPSGAAWTKGGHTAVANLLTFQDAAGAFHFPGASSPDPNAAFTTSQVPAALTLKPYGTATHFTVGLRIPAVAAPTPTPKPSPTAAVKALSGVPNTGGAPDAVTGVATGEGSSWGLEVALASTAAAVAAVVLGRRRRRRSA